MRHIETQNHHRTTTELDQTDVVTHKHWATGTEVHKNTETKRHMQHGNSHWGTQTMGHIKIEEHRYWNIHRHQDTQTLEHTVVRT